jgi:hypothetical protein
LLIICRNWQHKARALLFFENVPGLSTKTAAKNLKSKNGMDLSTEKLFVKKEGCLYF